MKRPYRGEAVLLETIRRHLRGMAPPAPRGMGDDAAILPRGAGETLISTDCLVEQEHFRRGEPAYYLGRKSIAVNLSDIAAMGGRATAFLLTLALPADLRGRFIDDMLAGIASICREYRLPLVGGDLSRSPGPLVVSITILGHAGSRNEPAPLTRAGARCGDGIYVSGPLGGSVTGRLLLEAGWRTRLQGRTMTGVSRPAADRGNRRPDRHLMRGALQAMKRHMDPVPRIELGHALRQGRIASAAIDLSDGLSTDLARLAAASRVGARLLGPAIPIHDAARACEGLGFEPLRAALDGGEEFELLFSVPPEREALLAGLDAVFIGRCVGRGQGLSLVDARGRRKVLRPRGYDHFRR